MKLFGKKKQAEPELPQFDPAQYEPVVRASICTGEKVACMRERTSGKLHEVMFIRTGADLETFCRQYGVTPEQVRTIY